MYFELWTRKKHENWIRRIFIQFKRIKYYFLKRKMNDTFTNEIKYRRRLTNFNSGANKNVTNAKKVINVLWGWGRQTKAPNSFDEPSKSNFFSRQSEMNANWMKHALSSSITFPCILYFYSLFVALWKALFLVSKALSFSKFLQK